VDIQHFSKNKILTESHMLRCSMTNPAYLHSRYPEETGVRFATAQWAAQFAAVQQRNALTKPPALV
jgi:hypothetical protein